MKIPQDWELKFSRNIDKITIRNIVTDYMKKYNYWWKNNKNIVIDVFYK
jgi:hypothetical protein